MFQFSYPIIKFTIEIFLSVPYRKHKKITKMIASTTLLKIWVYFMQKFYKLDNNIKSIIFIAVVFSIQFTKQQQEKRHFLEVVWYKFVSMYI